MTQQLLPTADGSGRVAACEVLVPNPAVRNLIREGKTHQIYSVLQTGSAQGMQTMDAALATLVRKGKITQKLAESRSSTPEELRRLLGAGALRPPRSTAQMSTYVFKAMDLAGVKARGEVEADSKQAVSDQLKSRGLIVLDIADKHASREIELSFLKTRQGQRAGRLLTPARDDDLLRHEHPARAVCARGADREQVPQGDDRPGAQGRRGGPVAERRDGAPPEGLQPAVRGDDAGRRGRRSARGLAACASPTSSRRTPRCAARSARRWSTRSWSSPSRSA